MQQHFRLRLLFLGRQALRSDPVQHGWLPLCQPSYKCAQEGEVYILPTILVSLSPLSR